MESQEENCRQTIRNVQFERDCHSEDDYIREK